MRNVKIELKEIKSAGIYVVTIPSVKIERVFNTLGMAKAYIRAILGA